MNIQIQRVYDSTQGSTGYRVLVDRLWPRGLSKEAVHMDLWLKEIAPSDRLRKWFGHDPAKWKDFRKRYLKELSEKHDLIDRLLTGAGRRPIVLLYGAKDTEHNQAAVLKEFLEESLVRHA